MLISRWARVARSCGSQAELREGRFGRFGRSGGWRDGGWQSDSQHSSDAQHTSDTTGSRANHSEANQSKANHSKGQASARASKVYGVNSAWRGGRGSGGGNTKIARVSISPAVTAAGNRRCLQGRACHWVCHPAHSHSQSHQIEVHIYLSNLTDILFSALLFTVAV
jgi:hypothetical protein